MDAALWEPCRDEAKAALALFDVRPAGSLSQFQLDGGIVNRCAGGGILPVLSEIRPGSVS